MEIGFSLRAKSSWVIKGWRMTNLLDFGSIKKGGKPRVYIFYRIVIEILFFGLMGAIHTQWVKNYTPLLQILISPP
jgi:hypothetical protein